MGKRRCLMCKCPKMILRTQMTRRFGVVSYSLILSFVILSCPKNTFKSSPTLCDACPELTETAGEGYELAGCTCIKGYQGAQGGPCQDVNECETGNGGCAQLCLNTAGSYRCKCNIPGYLVNMEDMHQCISKNSCPEIVPPANGRVVCLAATATNTELCTVKCNPGYEYLVPTNKYEECGPSTNWLWSFEIERTSLLPCMETFYPEIVLDGEAAYFMETCEELTEADLSELRGQFLHMLQSNGICTATSLETCTQAEVQVECGDFQEEDLNFDFGFFKKRDTTKKKGLLFRFQLKVKPTPVSEQVKTCAESCRELMDEEAEKCVQICADGLKKKNEEKVAEAKEKVKELFNVTDDSGQSVGGDARLTINNKRIVPAGGVVSDLPEIQCEKGMVDKNGVCAPCPPGSHKPTTHTSLCSICPQNSFQPKAQQTYCWRCPQDKPFSGKGSTECFSFEPTVPNRDFSVTALEPENST